VNADDVGNFFSRWSRRKLEETGQKPKTSEAAESAAVADGAPTPGPAAETHVGVPELEPLPHVDTLTPQSDFKPFMAPGVESGVKQAALKQLFKDPHFNVMDGLDTYIDDYSIADPIPDEMMKTMYQARQHLFSDEEKAAADAADAKALEDAVPETPVAYDTAAEVPEEYRLPQEAPLPDPKA
jgi:hypothetical protein